MKRQIRLPLWAAMVAGLVVAFDGLALLVWLVSSITVINTTSSMAEGLYIKWPAWNEPARGSLVLFCPSAEIVAHGIAVGGRPLAGSCPTKTAPFLKRVVAIAGDVVHASSDAIMVNGEPIARSPQLHDPSLRSLRVIRPGSYRVERGRVWVISDSPRGYDSRYYGPIEPKSIVYPLITWKAASQ